MSSDPYPRSARNELKRVADRGRYDRAAVHAILDEGLLAHVGFTLGDQPYVLPMSYVRIDEALYLHGSPANRMLRRLGEGTPACATVTLLDGLVLARSAFHHSMNFRSAVVFGRAREVETLDEREQALEGLVDAIVPGRIRDARAPNLRELKFTKVLALEIEQASAKVRAGPPHDDAADLEHPAWAGVIPLTLQAGVPEDDTEHPPTQPAPAYAKRYRRGAS